MKLSQKRPKLVKVARPRRTTRPIIVRRAPGRRCEARVQLGHGVRRAAIGGGGLRPLKCEGDGGTPVGRFPLRLVLYRADRVPRPRTPLPVRVIGASDSWCDDPGHRNYNRLVRLTSPHGSESLKREDALYDLVLVLGYNDRPRVKGRGSAIFVHIAREGYTPTEGCVAFSRRDLPAVLAEVKRGTTFLIMR